MATYSAHRRHRHKGERQQGAHDCDVVDGVGAVVMVFSGEMGTKHSMTLDAARVLMGLTPPRPDFRRLISGRLNDRVYEVPSLGMHA